MSYTTNSNNRRRYIKASVLELHSAKLCTDCGTFVDSAHSVEHDSLHDDIAMLLGMIPSEKQDQLPLEPPF